MKRSKSNRLIIGILCAIGSETLYGLSYIFTKSATQAATPFALLGWRFLTAAAAMSLLAALGFVKLKLKGKSLKPLLLVALCNPCMYFLGETRGISYTTASESGAFLACIPVVSLVASALILKKKPFGLQVAGICLTLIGVMVTVFAVGATSSLSVAGYGFLVVAVIAYALYGVFVEKADGYSGIEITYVMLVAGALVFGCLAVGEALLAGTARELLILPFENGGFAAAILYQGIGCSIAAVFLGNVAIATIGINRTASFIGISTVVSILAGAIILRESFNLYQVIGAAVILAGVYIANAGAGKRREGEE